MEKRKRPAATGIIGVIPARYGSTRFPGKPLALIRGKPMIQHVYERCQKVRSLDSVLVATDDARIYSCVTGFGGRAVMTSPRHQTGTDRIAEAIRKFKIQNTKFQIIINIQGDEPLISPRAIDLLAATMACDPGLRMATLATPFRDRRELESPDTVKIAVDREGFAMYFSRAVIPFIRDARETDPGLFLKHIGMYAYRIGFLHRFTAWPAGRLEKMEKLEQLRALERGVRIRVMVTPDHSPGVDTPRDLEQVRALLAKKNI